MYICKAIAREPLNHKYKITGSVSFYLMASDFKGFNHIEQILYNPNIRLMLVNHRNVDMIFNPKESVRLRCTIGNFGKILNMVCIIRGSVINYNIESGNQLTINLEFLN